MAFFPQLASGPISRGKSLLAQFHAPQKLQFDHLRDGVLLMIWGYFLKIVIADRAAIFVNTVYTLENGFDGWFLIVATLLFGVQLYCDFSGCTTIAMGAAKLLGIDLIDNFQAPYLSRSNAEFWRRWHISLSTWFRDYLYIPLGGNRKGKARKYLNVLITFAVSGLWHGAQWSFVFWGLLNGLYQVVGDLLRPVRRKLLHLTALDTDTLGHKVVQVVCTCLCVNLSWAFFRANRLMDSLTILHSMLTAKNFFILFDGSLYTCGLDAINFRLLLVYIGILFVVDLCKYKGIVIRRGIARQSWLCQVLVVTFGVLAILLLGVYGPGFEAADFIYSQF
ncbi:MBOAT family O-acyltransferase [uncultured Subdoligranulum sp.]|uniref:MBOAT family O-acyltransferase n=1 Tax=uncultured Subdoligranulum sp. TaxID=512298 RepID=UPI0026241687|nr:MBOAT family O-acyltransferase [uncultured Subdoligranulum sp.]